MTAQGWREWGPEESSQVSQSLEGRLKEGLSEMSGQRHGSSFSIPEGKGAGGASKGG